MLQHIRPAVMSLVLFTALLGIGYPLAVTGVAQTVFPEQANGQMIRNAKGEIVGSALIGQSFSTAAYFHGRPSHAGQGYDGSASSGSNLGPLHPDLSKRVASTVLELQSLNGAAPIPADAVTASASGLDPHISPDYARYQSARVAKARGVSQADVLRLIAATQEERDLGFLGQPRINVLKLNLALNLTWPIKPQSVMEPEKVDRP